MDFCYTKYHQNRLKNVEGTGVHLRPFITYHSDLADFRETRAVRHISLNKCDAEIHDYPARFTN